ncbi:MAG: two-component system regulatory protein YycI [Peptostreptococcaceae bacterium]|nr:two-component system regulatory protein YycI [Peptostreptococcaceae bacterium]
MDWTKAKTILIIAFIITNAFLFYNLEKDGPSSDNLSGLAAERIEEVEEILDKRGISLPLGIPREMPEVASLEVAYFQIDKYAEAEAFLVNGFNPGDDSFSKGPEALRVLEGKMLVYENTEVFQGDEPSIDDAVDSAEVFLEEKGFSLKDAILESAISENGLVELIYVQIVKDLPLENGRMELLVSTLGVARIERIWMEVISVGDSARKVIPAAKALLMALETLEERRINEIEGMDLIYLFDTKKTSLSKWQDIKSGTALPVWRIDLPEEGGSIYVDAYEGIVISN